MGKKTAENSESKKDQNKYATQREIAEFLDITEFEVKKYIRLGLPRAGNNKFVLKDASRWYVNHLRYWSDRRTISEISTMLGITERWLNRLIVEKGIPKESRGTYKLDATILGYVNYLKEQLKVAEAGERSLQDERKRLLRMQSDLKEIELLEKQENLIPKKLVIQLIGDFTSVVEKKLDSLPGISLNKLFACKSKEEILKIQKESIHHIKTEIAKSNHKLNETTVNK